VETITWLQAADILGLDPRSMRRWRARYEAGGPVALYDRRRGRPSRRQAPALEVQRILRLYRERFAGWNVRHFYRFARRDHTVTLSYSFIKYASHQEQPVVVPHVMHFRHVPLRTMVNWPQSPQASPS
jgi:transposase